MQRLGEPGGGVRALRGVERVLGDRDVEIGRLQLRGELLLGFLAGRQRLRLLLGLGDELTAQRVLVELALGDGLVRQLGAGLLGLPGKLGRLVPALAAAGDQGLGGGDLLRQSLHPAGRRTAESWAASFPSV